MTVSSTTSRVSYPGAGSTGPFTVPFRFFASADIEVYRRSSAGVELLLVVTTDYTVAGAGNSSGSVTLVDALETGETLVILRAQAVLQPADFENAGTFYGKDHQNALDKLCMVDQTQQDKIDRSLKLEPSLDPDDYDLTIPDPETGKVMTGTGTGFTMSELDSSAVALPGESRTVATLSALLANAYGRNVYNVKDYGAVCNGTTDETALLIAACAACASAGGGTVLIPGDIRVGSTDWSVGMPASPVIGFSAVHNVTIVCTGEIFFDRAFTLGQQVDLFEFTGCVNPTIVAKVRTPSHPITDARGLVVTRLRGGCRNAVVRIHAQYCCASLICTAVSGAADSARTLGVDFLIHAESCEYGAVFEFSGDNAVGQLTTDIIARSYFVYGAKRHKIQINSKNNRADDCLIRVYLGCVTEDIDVKYVNKGSTTASTSAPCVSIAPNVASGTLTPGTIRNITLDIHVEYGGVQGPGHAFYVYRSIDDATLDVVDRGHRLENFDVSVVTKGANQGNTANPVLALYDGAAGWGAGEFVLNWRIRRIRAENAISAITLALTSLLGYCLIENIETDFEAYLSAGVSGNMVVIASRAQALVLATTDTTRITYIDCTFTANTRLAFRNKLYIGCNVNGQAFNQLVRASTTAVNDGTAVIRNGYSGEKTHDFPSLAVGAQQTTTVTVTGVTTAMRGKVLVSVSVDQAGVDLFGYISAADTVTVVQRNDTAGAVDWASATLHVDVLVH